jgi:sugar-specific transcriptional regulator TrmB
MDVAPAFDMVATASENAAKEAARQLETAIGNAGISASSMADIITKGMLGQMERSEAGIALANMVVGGVYTAVAQNAIQPVIDLIVSGIIQPVIAAAIAGEAISGAVSQQSIDAVLASAQAAMQAIGQIFNDPGFQALMGELTSTFNNLIPQSSFTPYIPQTYTAPVSSANAYKDAVDNALKTLEKSINAQKEILNAQLKTQQDLVKSIEELISVLDSNIKELLNSVDAVVTMNARQGAQFITNALAQAIQNGTLPNTKDLSEAISAVRTEIDQGNYASKFEADRARLILAGQLDQLKVTSTAQKSNAEMQLDSLNSQLEYLDSLLEQSKAQVDALYGVSNAVTSVSSAITSLQSAILNYKPGGSTAQPTYGASFGGGSGGSLPIGGVNGMGYGADGKALGPNGGVKGYFNPDGSVRNGSQEFMLATLTGNGFDANRYLALNPDVAAWYNANGAAAIAAADQGKSIEQFALYHFSKHGASEGRAYADGGVFSNSIVTQPTNFNADLMGEAGPEAIVPLSKMPDGSLGVRSNTMAEDFKALVASNNELRKELIIMRQQMQKATSNSTQQLKLLEDVVRGGELISVEVTNTVKTTSV